MSDLFDIAELAVCHPTKRVTDIRVSMPVQVMSDTMAITTAAPTCCMTNVFGANMLSCRYWQVSLCQRRPL